MASENQPQHPVAAVTVEQITIPETLPAPSIGTPVPSRALTPLEDAPVPGVVEGEVLPATRHSRIEVARGGAIDIVDDESQARETVAEVTGDTFFMSVDLNAIAGAVRDSQRNNGRTDDPAQRVYVGREGELLMGNDVQGADRISEVTKDTFYTAADRLAEEAFFVRSNMPRNTVRVSDGEYSGWHFSIVNEFGDKYSLFLYYHDGYQVYRVALVEPRLGGTVDAHGTHLFSDGTLCLTQRNGSGYPSMATTYAKAALWTRGASCYRRGHGFQFNIGQD